MLGGVDTPNIFIGGVVVIQNTPNIWGFFVYFKQIILVFSLFQCRTKHFNYVFVLKTMLEVKIENNKDGSYNKKKVSPADRNCTYLARQVN